MAARATPDVMDSYYSRPYAAEDLETMMEIGGHDPMMGMMMGNSMETSGMMGQSLNGMMNHNHNNNHHNHNHNNNKELHRVKAVQDYSNQGQNRTHGNPRRSSMLEFGSGNNGELAGYQFDAPTSSPIGNMPQPASLAQRRFNYHSARRSASTESLALNTQFQSPPQDYSPMTSSSPYVPSLNHSVALPIDMTSNYMSSGAMMGGMDFSPHQGLNGANGDLSQMDMYSQAAFLHNMQTSPMPQNMPESIPGGLQDPGGGINGGHDDSGLMEKMSPSQANERMPSLSMQASPQAMPPPAAATSNPQRANSNGITSDISIPQTSQIGDQIQMPIQDTSLMPVNPEDPATSTPVTSQFQNAYSSSGFDMLGVLSKVAARKNAFINIGAVDLSCAFAVCDVQQHDMPIVYCSDVFERLTGYTKHEILGRNCRFLQSPDGKIQGGKRRVYVDDDSVWRIKKMITNRKEMQISIINYRKGGQPFMNLLTMIPITWDTDEIKYYVGFQVDLVEQPTSITSKNPDGTYTINYQRGLLPRYVLPEMPSQSNADVAQTVGRDEVSTVLNAIGTTDSDLSRRIWDRVLLENTDDVVHVLSLKGLFLYLSPSSRKVLEYEPSELVGTALSSICHPSDIVPVTRELKDTSAGAAVNVVFRIRRKHNGYTWFESHGSLHLEHGKGRKCIVMVGRERPVYALARKDIDSVGGIGEIELWTKMSTSGMFLFVSSNVRSLLDRQPEELVGTSAQALMRPDSKREFGKMLELARTGVKATFQHDIQNKRGQTLQARTSIYPGDANEGTKPTFLVAQTRLIKMSRAGSGSNKHATSSSPKLEQQKSGSPDTSSSVLSGEALTPKSGAPREGPMGQQLASTEAGGNGLTIGTQDEALASEENVFEELKTTRSTSWQFELRQMEKRNRLLAEELQSLLSSKKKRKRRNGAGNLQKDCANCHTRVTPEWRRGPSGNRDLCNSCGLRWAKEVSKSRIPLIC